MRLQRSTVDLMC